MPTMAVASITSALPYFIDDGRLYFTLIGFVYFAMAVYASASRARDYPDWFWALYLAVSGVILLNLSADELISGPLATHAEAILFVVASVLGFVFFWVMTIYATHREEFDKILNGNYALVSDITRGGKITDAVEPEDIRQVVVMPDDERDGEDEDADEDERDED